MRPALFGPMDTSKYTFEVTLACVVVSLAYARPHRDARTCVAATDEPISVRRASCTFVFDA